MASGVVRSEGAGPCPLRTRPGTCRACSPGWPGTPPIWLTRSRWRGSPGRRQGRRSAPSPARLTGPEVWAGGKLTGEEKRGAPPVPPRPLADWPLNDDWPRAWRRAIGNPDVLGVARQARPFPLPALALPVFALSAGIESAGGQTEEAGVLVDVPGVCKVGEHQHAPLRGPAQNHLLR